MREFELAVELKALLASAKSGQWDICDSILSAQGPDCVWWQKQSLMGKSPQAEAFGRTMSGHPAPPQELFWKMTIGGSAQKIDQAFYDSLVGKEQFSAKSAHALDYMAKSQIVHSWRGAYGWVADFGKDLDVSLWASSTEKLALAGDLDPSWRSASGFWSVCALASQESQQELASALLATGEANPLAAAAAGALVAFEYFASKLDSEQSLALFVVSQCQHEGDWDSFKEAAGDLHDWNRLALAAIGFVDSLGEDGEDVFWILGGRGLIELNRSEGFKQKHLLAISSLARKGQKALLDLPGLKKWGLESLDDWAGTTLWPELIKELDFSSDGPKQVRAKMGLVQESDPNLAIASAKAAANRLFDLLGEQELKAVRFDWFRGVAEDLWKAKTPDVFGAFVDALSMRMGTSGQAMEACGYPQAIPWRFDHTFQSPEHVEAILSRVPHGSKGSDGDDLWGDPRGRDSVIKSVWEKAKESYRISNIETEGAHNSKWELSMLGIARFAAACENPREIVRQMLEAKIGKGEPSMPKAYEELIAEAPGACAEFFAKHWMGNQEQTEAVDAICKSLGASSLSALAASMPAAFEAFTEGWGSHQKSESVARACRRAANTLGQPDLGTAYGTDEMLCAALAAASSHGFALWRKKLAYNAYHETVSFQASSKELALMLPEAGRALSHGAWEGPEGFSSADLVGKALWGFLSHAAASPRFETAEPFALSWRGVAPAAGNPWAESCLCGLFSQHAKAAGVHWAEAWLVQALHWLASCGVKGHMRLEGEPSALEMSTECRIGDSSKSSKGSGGSFGEGVAALLVGAGADPSSPLAPFGRDALALCARLDRSDSPSKLFKELLKSRSACPGRGRLWGELGSGRSSLSQKKQDELLLRIGETLEMGSLASLGAICPAPLASKWIQAALLSHAPSIAMAPSLLGAMAASGAPAVACQSVAMALEKAKIEPSQESKARLAKRLVEDFGQVGSWTFADLARDWMAAGAMKTDLARYFDVMKESPGLADAAKALGLSCLDKIGEHGLARSAQMVAEEDWRDGARLAKYSLEWADGAELEKASDAWIRFVDGSADKESVRVEMGEDWAKMEALAIGASAKASLSFKASSKRI